MANIAELPVFSQNGHLTLDEAMDAAAVIDDGPRSAEPSVAAIFFYSDFVRIRASEEYTESAKNFLASGIQGMYEQARK